MCCPYREISSILRSVGIWGERGAGKKKTAAENVEGVRRRRGFFFARKILNPWYRFRFRER